MIAYLLEPANAAWIMRDLAILMGVLLVVLAVQGVRRRAQEDDMRRAKERESR
jgi:hypothetical protein